MKKKNEKVIVGILIVTLIFINFFPVIAGFQIKSSNKIDSSSIDAVDIQDDVVVICHTFGFPGEPSHETVMSLNEAELLLNKIRELQIKIARDPLSDKTKQLQHEIITLADEHNLLPAGLSVEKLQSRLTPLGRPQSPKKTLLPQLQNRAYKFFCNYVSTGSGSALPIIVLPRLIPILLTPIPRLFVRWSATEGVTSCGGLLSGTGFIAYGQQKGFALGFWGIGFSIFLPPVMAYGIFGYALFATVTADNIELYPPNRPPVISDINPPDGAVDVSQTLTELSFRIEDADGDLMDYTVTTTPDIGSGSGTSKNDGVYTVPISGLEGLIEYLWHVSVTDGEDTTEANFTFITEAVEPIVSNPCPPDGARNILLNLSQLSFTLTDYQGDPIDWTVETVPDIGSGSASGVGNGDYTVDVSGIEYDMDYTWYLNATDGEHWARKVFQFKSRPVSAPWWDGNWSYRKEMIVDCTQVEDNLNNFPVLIRLDSDIDLASNAQNDGDDIIFTDYSGSQLNHEIEFFNYSDGELTAWVNVPTFTPATILYMYYGNPECNNQENVEGTWNTNYEGVWHLSETGTGTRYDSTSYGNDGNPINYDGDEATTGQIDGADELDGLGDNINMGNSACDITDEITISLWFKTGDPSDENKAAYMVCNERPQAPDNGYCFGFAALEGEQEAHTLWARFMKDNNRDKFVTTDTFVDNTWHYAVTTYLADGSSRPKIYVDGVEQSGSLGEGPLDGIGVTPDRSFRIGVGSSGIHSLFNGAVDEVRVSNSVKNSEWISTEYNNQNDLSSFFSIGNEESAP